MGEIVMPRLTDSMEEGVILAWLKADGDEIAVGDELVEIETDKASMVYESDLAGTLKITVPDGETRPIGETIATIGDGDSPADSDEEEDANDEEDAPATGDEEKPEPADETPDPDPDPAPSTPSGSENEPESGERIKASPLAKRIAEEKGVDLASLSGSGPGGRVIKIDVEQAGRGEEKPEGGGRQDAPATEPAKGSPEILELTRTQQVIAKRMSESKATIPHFYLRRVINMDRAIEIRRAFKAGAAEGDPVPSLNDFVVKAVAIALKSHPKANAAFRDGHFELYPKVNVGIAVATEGALLVPVIRDADRLALSEIAAESRRLAENVRSGEVTPPELAGGTFSVSNLGMFGVSGFDAVINPGQAGILAVGEVSPKPVAGPEGITTANLMEVTLACDHRILYGADGAEFLASIGRNLEEPGLLA